MTKQTSDIAELQELLYAARIIIEERNLYAIWEHIPTSSEPNYSRASMGQYIHQGLYFQTYIDWTDKLEDVFSRNNLDFLRFKMLTTARREAGKSADQPAQAFLRKVNELDRIVNDQTVLKAYKTSRKLVASWPKVTYKDGKISQGAKTHNFREPTCQKVIDTLCDNRRIETPTGLLLKSEKPLSREQVNSHAQIKSHERFTDIATTIHKGVKSKDISLKLKYPDSGKVFLLVCQTSL